MVININDSKNLRQGTKTNKPNGKMTSRQVLNIKQLLNKEEKQRTFKSQWAIMSYHRSEPEKVDAFTGFDVSQK